MEHLTLKAVTTPTTDQGLFEAVISTESVDRENDVVLPDAMVEALHAWTFTGKMIPLHWDHSSEPEDIVGHVNPATVKAVDGEVVASGWVDQSTDRGRHVWRLAKAQTLGFSFGYLIPDGGAVKRADGVKEIRKLDVFEVSATPAPMNNDTRVLSTKAVEGIDPRIVDEVGAINAVFDGIRIQARDDMVRRLTQTTGVDPTDQAEKALPSTKSAESPVQVATFDC